MEETALPMVTFGKYKDKSMLDLLADKGYVEWLKKQSWFQKKTQLYNIVVHQNISKNQNEKSPEHNKLQNLFLDHNNVEKLGNFIIARYKYKCHPIQKLNSYKIEFEGKYNWDCIFNFDCAGQCLNGRNCCSSEESVYCIDVFSEIKPIMGDDYPCVLRKMKNQIELTKSNNNLALFKHFLLIIKEYNSNTTTKEQLVKIFKQTNIKILFIDELISPIETKEDFKPLEYFDAQKTKTTINLKKENELLREKLLQAEETIKQLEGQKQSKNTSQSLKN